MDYVHGYLSLCVRYALFNNDLYVRRIKAVADGLHDIK